MVSEECKIGRRMAHLQIQTQGWDKVACLLMGDLCRAARERKRETLFSSLNENGRNVSLPTAPCGIIKNGDAKDSLIRFFNYWGFTSPSIVAQLESSSKTKDMKRGRFLLLRPPPPCPPLSRLPPPSLDRNGLPVHCLIACPRWWAGNGRDSCRL